MTRIAILGSTGSIGKSALAVVDAHPDRLQVVALAAGRNADALARRQRGTGLDSCRSVTAVSTALAQRSGSMNA